ncbi:MAG: GxxExxY protein [Bacteroidota bacterium]
MTITKKYIDQISFEIIGAAIEVHKELGPGLLESIYHRCMKEELSSRNLTFFSELITPVHYKGKVLETELRCDFLVENLVVVELKTVEAFAPVHEAQLLSYMRLLEKPKGILINFYCSNIFKEGQKTMVNEIYKALP